VIDHPGMSPPAPPAVSYALPPRARKAPFADLLDDLNRGRPELARVAHDATLPFGPALRVDRFVLGNGLRILLLRDTTAPVVCLQTWFGVGSRHERAGKTGIAHLFEHLMFGETEDVPHGAFDRLLEEAGAETNAATFLDWTYYHMNLPKDALDLAMRLESGRIARLVLREPQVKSEKEVVANERRQRVEDDVDGAVSELLYKEAFPHHGYGWPTIGWMADIQGFTPEDCVAFYRTYYAPNNASLVLVGDFDLGEVLRLVQTYYGALAPSAIPVEDVHPEPPQIEERRAVSRQQTPTEKAAIGYRGPALGDFDHAPLTLLNEILFGGRSSRVHRALIQEKEIASEVRGWVGSFRDPGLYDIFLSARAGHTAERRRARSGQGAARAVGAPGAGDGRRQGRADRLLRDGPRRAGGALRAARPVPEGHRERSAAGRAALPRPHRAIGHRGAPRRGGRGGRAL
jgi:zinc protease